MSRQPDCSAKHNRPEHESRVPLLGVLNGHDAEVQKDDAVHERGQRLDSVLDGGVGLLGDVGKGIALLHEPAPDEAEWQFNRKHFGLSLA